MAAVFNLNHHASYAHWHFFSMSVSNLLVIAAMFVVFFAAILIPFPGHGRSGDSAGSDPSPTGEGHGAPAGEAS